MCSNNRNTTARLRQVVKTFATPFRSRRVRTRRHRSVRPPTRVLSPRRCHSRHMNRVNRGRWLVVGTAALTTFAAALVLFQPWKLFVDEFVNEALPVASPAASAPPSIAPDQPSAGTSPVPTISTVVLASGSFRSYEHTTTGTARIIRLADGRVIARLENLSTSNGPDVHVWLSPATVGDDASGLSAGHVDLGVSKGNKGNANYLVPRGVDPAKYKTVALWCERFSVAFGAATVR